MSNNFIKIGEDRIYYNFEKNMLYYRLSGYDIHSNINNIIPHNRIFTFISDNITEIFDCKIIKSSRRIKKKFVYNDYRNIFEFTLINIENNTEVTKTSETGSIYIKNPININNEIQPISAGGKNTRRRTIRKNKK